MMSKKVVIFVKNLTSGGAEKQSAILAKALSENNEVSYIVFNGNKIHKKYLAFLDSDRRIQIYLLRGYVWKRFRMLYDIMKNESIEYCFSYLTMANLIAAIMGKITATITYSSIRNASLPWYKEVIDRVVCNYLSHKTISNSFSGKDHFVIHGFNEKKIIVIPNCFLNITAYKDKERKSDNVRIITVGRFVVQKDYLTAIKVIAELKANYSDIEFLIVGYGKLESEIRRWIVEYGIDDITKIFINPDNIQDLENNSDIYLSTSLFEGLSNSIMEGMNANLPIVCTDVGDNNRLVKNSLNGYICPVGDVRSIVNALVSLCKNVNQRQAFGKISKQILENYDIETFRKSYNKLL